MKKKEIIINADFRMKVVNFLKIYGYYGGVLVQNGNDKKYSAGQLLITDIITNKKDFKELKTGVKVVLDCCYENSYNEIEQIMNVFYKDECKEIRQRYGGFFDKN